MKYLFCALTSIIFVFSGCKVKKEPKDNYESGTLIVKKLSENTFVHISYLEIPNYGKFPCNGLIFVDGKEAIVFDTPTNDTVSTELMDWIRKELDCDIKAVVVSHFHTDCLGGLQAFHDQGVASYAHNKTIELAKKEGVILPKIGFDGDMEIQIGKEKIATTYFGGGHTKDNVVGYLPSEKILFGGCLIKEMGAGKGNLEDATVQDWSNTVIKIKNEYLDLHLVVPGHGKPGGTELLDYTIQLFHRE